MWLSLMLFILFMKNNIFVFFNEFQIIFNLNPSSMTVLIEYNWITPVDIHLGYM